MFGGLEQNELRAPWLDHYPASVPKRLWYPDEPLGWLLEEAGARVSCLEPAPGLPDLVFTANAALVYEDPAILSRFRHAERKREEPRYRAWFLEHEFRVHVLESGTDFEGAGDALFCGDTLFAGYPTRSHIRAHQEIAAVLGCRVIPLELVHPRQAPLGKFLKSGGSAKCLTLRLDGQQAAAWKASPLAAQFPQGGDCVHAPP